MTKYYRVIKDNPIWEIGAILEQKDFDEHKGYEAIEDIWDKHKNHLEYLTATIVEGSPDFFERVYRSETDKMVFKTTEEMKKLYSRFFPDKKKL